MLSTGSPFEVTSVACRFRDYCSGLQQRLALARPFHAQVGASPCYRGFVDRLPFVWSSQM